MNTISKADILAQLKNQEGFFQEDNFISCDDFDAMENIAYSAFKNRDYNCRMVVITRKAGDGWKFRSAYAGGAFDMMDIFPGHLCECVDTFENSGKDETRMIELFADEIKMWLESYDFNQAKELVEKCELACETLDAIAEDEFLAIGEDWGVATVAKRYVTHYYDEGNSVEYRIALEVFE